MFKFIREFLLNSNLRGWPIPLVRDPKNKRGDVALTLVFISAIYIQIGLLASFWDKKFDTYSAFEWFLACAGLYWARKVSSKNEDIGGSIEDDPTKKNDIGK